MIANINKYSIFADNLQETRGISSSGRAFDWQSKGNRFESDILHQRD